VKKRRLKNVKSGSKEGVTPGPSFRNIAHEADPQKGNFDAPKRKNTDREEGNVKQEIRGERGRAFNAKGVKARAGVVMGRKSKREKACTEQGEKKYGSIDAEKKEEKNTGKMWHDPKIEKPLQQAGLEKKNRATTQERRKKNATNKKNHETKSHSQKGERGLVSRPQLLAIKRFNSAWKKLGDGPREIWER